MEGADFCEGKNFLLLYNELVAFQLFTIDYK